MVFYGSEFHPLLTSFSKRNMKVKTVSTFNLFDTCASVDICVEKLEMNRFYHYYSCPLFEKSENVKESIRSKNAIFLRFAYVEKVKSA